MQNISHVSFMLVFKLFLQIMCCILITFLHIMYHFGLAFICKLATHEDNKKTAVKK